MPRWTPFEEGDETWTVHIAVGGGTLSDPKPVGDTGLVSVAGMIMTREGLAKMRALREARTGGSAAWREKQREERSS